jgi:hypothetical protein
MSLYRLVLLGLVVASCKTGSTKVGRSGVDSSPEVDTQSETDADTDTDTDTDVDCTSPSMAFDGVGTEAPAQVSLRVEVTCEGAPVAGLEVEDFSLSEDGSALDAEEVSLTLLPLALGYQHATIFAVDMTGDLGDGDGLASVQAGLRLATSDLDAAQLPAIWGFDGRSEPVVLAALTSDAAVLEAGIDGLTTFSMSDSSRNLDGTVVAGLDALDARAGGSLRDAAPGLGELLCAHHSV